MASSLHWFRKGLRLHDNQPLRESIENSATFRAVFFLDRSTVKNAKVSVNRWRFLLECLRDLDQSLREIGSRLFIIEGQPIDVLPKLIKQWNITKLTFEYDSEPFPRQRDLAVRRRAEQAGVQVIVKTSHTLYDIAKFLESDVKTPITFKQFCALFKRLPAPEQCAETVDKNLFASCVTPVEDDEIGCYEIPTFDELGLDLEDEKGLGIWRGGETEALNRLQALLNELADSDCKESSNDDWSPFPKTTKMSPYLRFGCISPRLIFHELTKISSKASDASHCIGIQKGLLWREFFFVMASKNPALDKMCDNCVCLPFPWEQDVNALERWKEGKTGFPWIDAIMRQLKQEGWIHHIARQAVGCFLTRGCLWISWEEGFKVFEELQLDAEWSVNSGSWLWLSCSAFFHSQIPWFCPVTVGQKLDPSGNYIRKYVPELATMPNKYIFHPWTAPEGIQCAARCVIGKDYPKPIADYVERRNICLQRLKEVCHQIVTTTISTLASTA